MCTCEPLAALATKSMAQLLEQAAIPAHHHSSPSAIPISLSPVLHPFPASHIPNAWVPPVFSMNESTEVPRSDRSFTTVQPGMLSEVSS